jgi:alpha/beta superfamily hydrolase
MGELQVADVKAQVGLSLFTDFENFSVFKPAPQQERSVNAMLDQVIAWGGALKALRKKQTEDAVESTADKGEMKRGGSRERHIQSSRSI